MHLLLKNFEEISKLKEDIINDLSNVTQIEIKEREPLQKCKIIKRIKNGKFG